MTRRSILIAGLLSGCRSSDQVGEHESQTKSADLVLRNGKMVTLDLARPEAEALAIQGDMIVAVGTDKEIKPYVRKSTRIVDLAGELAIPGFIDGHAHFLSLGEAKLNLDLTRTKNWEEIVAIVRDEVRRVQPGEWIVGRGWHQDKWDRSPMPNVQGFPTHDSLSAVSPDHPVMLAHASGHASFANAKAMELAHVTKTTPDPPGGEILRDSKGNPIGVFLEAAAKLLQNEASARRTPRQREAHARRGAKLAAEECLSKGITSFQDAGASFEDIDLFKKLVEEDTLGIRLWAMIRESNDRLAQRLAEYKIANMGDHRLTVGGIKKWMDGALGSRGAWLLEPYSDSPNSTGMNVESIKDITETARLAVEHRFQLCVHAIGDRANREALNIFEATFKAHPLKRDWRWRVEHVSVLHPDDLPRFAQLGVIASMQGYFCPSDASYVEARLGMRRCEERVYVWQKLLKSGALVINGSDAPVEDVSPIIGFHASITRKAPDGTVFYPDQRMSRQQALRSYTLAAATAAFEEDTKGSLSPRKLADITVLSKDILTVPEEEILSTDVLYTIVGGKVMYKKKGI